MNAVGVSTYRLIRTLVSPDKVTDVSFADIVQKAKGHFNPKPSPIVKRYEFNTRCQKEAESIATYVAELRKIAEHCEYGPVLSDMLRDRLVCGIHNKTIQRRLLQVTDLTFDKALETTLAAEAADKDSKRIISADNDLHTQTNKVQDLPSPNRSTSKSGRGRRNRPQQRSGEKQQGTSNPVQLECSRCGGKHEQSHCPFKQYECHNCRKKGHLARKCRTRGQESHEKTHHVVEEEPEPQDVGEYTMFHVSSGQTGPLHATVTVNGSPLAMEINTGTSVSIASRETFESIQKGESTLELKETTVKLQTYTGEPIRVCGSTVVQVEHNGQTTSLPLVITEGSGPTLLGRNWLEALRLDWRTIFRIGSNFTLQQVLNQHTNVFKEELGELRGVAAKIHVDETSQPHFVKPRQMPFAIREKVEQELERLLSLGIIEPVQFSDWAAPIVPVLKSDGRVRICGDYKVTINRAAKLEKYPIPRIEELFATLAGGKTFSKLDL